ncbi:hypothetical protein QQ054_32030 [Oscillatoria amoena NRMC-F 0135]|nr:hypothetical protein [Oscillatoria amoena NRMC-F 0135]
MSLNLIPYDKDMPLPTGWYIAWVEFKEVKQWALLHFDMLFNCFDIAPFDDDFSILKIELLPENE